MSECNDTYVAMGCCAEAILICAAVPLQILAVREVNLAPVSVERSPGKRSRAGVERKRMD